MEKTIVNIITNRLRPVSEEAEGQKQCDFTADTSYIDQMFTREEKKLMGGEQ